MIEAKHYELSRDTDGFLRIRNLQPPLCPDCGILCSGYDTRKRKLKDSDGSVYVFKLRRYHCPECGRYHLELPSLMEPRKHYEKAVIARVRSGDATSCPAEDSTIRRWRK